MKDLFRGELIRLTAEEPVQRAKYQARWQLDTEYQHLMSGGVEGLFSEKTLKEQFERMAENGFNPESYYFSIRTLADDQLVGFLGMWLDLIYREVWMGVGLGNRANWSKGYGTDAMRLCLQYAFMELNAHRISLGVYEYNSRALHVYEKAGFRLEGRTRRDILHGDQRFDSLWMGILRDEWLTLQKG